MSASNEKLLMIKDSASSLCEAEGLEFIHAEFLSEGGRLVLRVYIDKVGGVTLEDCSAISRQLGDICDVMLENSPEYTLEVSSPGFDRPLVKEADYIKFAGKKAKIRVKIPISGQKTFTGIIQGFEEESVIILTLDSPVKIPLTNITTSRVVYEYGDK